MRELAVAFAAFLLVTPAQAQFSGVTFAAGAANIPVPDFTSCDFNPPTTFNHIWYVDPGAGQTQSAMGTAGISLNPGVTPHQGDSTHPWNSLNAVFATVTGYPRPLLTTAAPGGSPSLSPIAPGDEILLNTGTGAQYGNIAASSGFASQMVNPTYLTFAPAPGQTPVFNALTITGGNRLHFTGITIQQFGGGGIAVNGNANVSKNVMFDNMSVSTADYATAATWTTQAAWIAGMGFSSGLSLNASDSCISMTNSHIFIVDNGITLSGTAGINHILLQNNEIDHWGEDALDYEGQFIVIDHNHLHDPVGLGNGTHMDFMQGFCACGKTSSNIWINGNLEIFQEDPALPFIGLGAYDGGIVQTNDQWTNLFITNNLVSVGPFPHGIGVGGCNDCVVANNTDTSRFEVNAADITRGGVYKSSHITVTNNIMGYSGCTDPTVNETNNIIMKGTITNSTVCFGGVISANFGSTPGMQIGNNLLDTGGVNSELTNIDPVGLIYNFHLLSTAPARGFGLSTLPRPLSDAFGVPQNSPVDAGAVAYP